jgi:hypothetical protein
MFPKEVLRKIKKRVCEELKHVLDKFLKYHIKSLLGDFNANVSREDIFKPTIGNGNLHKIINDNGSFAFVRPWRKSGSTMRQYISSP